MTSKKILLASFVTLENVYEAIDKISSVLNLEKDKIFVFEILDGSNQYILTYNIDAELTNLKFSSFWKDTISIHRKKETNTLFSLNAMNELIKKHNNGIKNKNIQLEWKNYQNSFLIYRNNSIFILPIKRVLKLPTY